jgi:nucleotide-binding universal stress UspA family protein
MYGHILVPIDGSDHALRAVDHAADLAKRYSAKLTLLHVVREQPYGRLRSEIADYEHMEHMYLSEAHLMRMVGKDLLDAAEKRARNVGVGHVITVVEQGPAARVIADHAASYSVDLIVMGSRGLSDLPSMLLGGVSHKVIHMSQVPVMTVR